MVDVSSTTALLLCPSTPLTILQAEGRKIVLLGDAYLSFNDGRATERLPNRVDVSSHDAALALLGRCWGDFVSFSVDAEGGLSATRSPSGVVQCYIFQDHLSVAYFSDMRLLGADKRLSINRSYLRKVTTYSRYVGRDTGITEVSELLPGETCTLIGSVLVRRTNWSPSSLLENSYSSSFVANQADLKRVVIDCIAAQVSSHTKLSISLSGGLDSAVVLGCLRESSSERIIHGFNLFDESLESDERGYAKDVAEYNGIPLSFINLENRVNLELDTPRRETVLPAPSSSPMTDAAAEAEAEFAQQVDATAILTGIGGDAVFFKPSDGLVAADYAFDHGIRGLGKWIVRGAVEANTTIWKVLATALWYGRGRSVLDPLWELRTEKGYLSTDDAAAFNWETLAHPWVAEIGGKYGPAKILQVAAITDSLCVFRSDAYRHLPRRLHPIHSQPIVEACLALQCYELVPFDIDRGLVRQVFGQYIPCSVALRRSKGGATSLFSRMATTNLRAIRSFLLDGRLRSIGILDEIRIEEDVRRAASGMFDAQRRLLSCLPTEKWMRELSEFVS